MRADYAARAEDRILAVDAIMTERRLTSGQQRFLGHLQAEQGLTVWTGRMAQTGGRWYEKGVDVKITTVGG